MWVQMPIKREQANGQIPELLEQALERLKDLTGLGLELKVVWKPGHSKLAGEVIGKTIFIFTLMTQTRLLKPSPTSSQNTS
jgi:hypothetical protein